VRYNVEEQAEEQIFMGKPLLTHTTKEDILNLQQSQLETMC
jgi:hypothetical protein